MRPVDQSSVMFRSHPGHIPASISKSNAARLIFLSGINLILIQWVLIRELITVLLGTELVVLLVSVSYFAGLSTGYLFTYRLRPQWLLPLSVFTFLTHLTLPVWFRLLVIILEAVDAYPLVFIVLPVLTALLVPAFYSIFLPYFIDTGKNSLPGFYTIELIGSMTGIVILVILGGTGGIQSVYTIYVFVLTLILLLLKIPRIWLIPLTSLGILWLVCLPVLHYWSNALLFEHLQGLPYGSKTLFSGYSPYQKVDVIETPDRDRYLFLDGLEHFGSPGGSRLNVLLGTVPAQLIHPEKALVIGAGSMEMERLIADTGSQVTTVEIDPLVVQTSVKYFTVYNQMDVLKNRMIVIDDAKHFMANTDQSYDLITTDTPAAFTIQTATLYSEPFFRQVKARLNQDGLFAVNLTGKFQPDHLTSRRIAATLLVVFNEVWVVTSESAGWSFAYAGDKPTFDKGTLEAILRANGESDYTIFEPASVRVVAGNAMPVTLDTMDIVLRDSFDWIQDRLK